MIPSNLNSHQSAAYGCTLGALVGDAAGAVLEFWGRKLEYRDVQDALSMPGGGCFGVAPGQITDDGELALALAAGLAANQGRYDVNEVARQYVDWAASSPFDMGRATSEALRSVQQGPAVARSCAARAKEASGNSKANGALMRITPLAVASAQWSEEEAVKYALSDAKLTHPNAACGHANAAYVLAIRHLVLTPGDAPGAVAKAREYVAGQQTEVYGWLEDALVGELENPRELIGFVRHGFSRAFFHLHQKSGFREALSETLAAGGDTDTNACIVGGLIGAYRGINKLIQSSATSPMFHAVLSCDTQAGQKRPERYHSKRMLEHMRQLIAH